MVKQLYYSEIHLKNIEIYLSKLYIGTYYDVIKYMQKTSLLLMVGAVLIMSRVEAAVFV